MTDLQRHEEVEIHAATAHAERAAMARAAIEKSNRRLGQHLRRSLASIETSRREFNK